MQPVERRRLDRTNTAKAIRERLMEASFQPSLWYDVM
jgi:hypothetical protein